MTHCNVLNDSGNADGTVSGKRQNTENKHMKMG